MGREASAPGSTPPTGRLGFDPGARDAVSTWTTGGLVSTRPNKTLQARVEQAAQAVLSRAGRITYSELFVELGILSREDLLAWRTGQVPFLERVVQGNLNKLARMRTSLRRFARDKGLHRDVARLPRRVRFSKSGFPAVEEEYRAIYVPPPTRQRASEAELASERRKRRAIALKRETPPGNTRVRCR